VAEVAAPHRGPVGLLKGEHVGSFAASHVGDAIEIGTDLRLVEERLMKLVAPSVGDVECHHLEMFPHRRRRKHNGMLTNRRRRRDPADGCAGRDQHRRQQNDGAR
jgi:hypothetical protein